MPDGRSTRLARHLQSCGKNPDNACSHCGEPVPVWDRRQHERTCVQNSAYASKTCRWCHQVFEACAAERSQAGFSTAGKLARHLQVCPRNQENACQHCGQVVPEWEKGYHEGTCCFHPNFEPLQCRWCHQRVEADEHERQEAGFTTAEKLEAHERLCAPRHGGRPGQSRGRPGGPRQGEAPRARSQDTRFDGLSPDVLEAVETTIGEITARLEGLGRAEKKKALRALQLQYHPDKNAERHEFSSEVFRFVQTQWDTEFR